MKPIEVSKAFGGFAFLKSKALFNCRWDSKGESEHFSLCNALLNFGKIYLIPSIKPSVNIEQKTWNHEHLVIEKQKKLLADPWNRFLWKTGSLNLE